MRTTTVKSAFFAGMIASSPFILVVVPFAALFGLLATQAGLSVVQTLTFSVTVIAGAPQLTALQLMQEDVPTALVLVSALAVNLRVAMYGAALTPWIGSAPLWQRALAAYFLTDQAYVVGILAFERAPEMTVPQRMAYYFGVAAAVAPLWYLFTLIGALATDGMPEGWALDFALPITFLAMIAPMLRTLPHVVAALVAIAVSLPAAALPWSLGLIVAGVAGMIAGAETERRIARRRAR